MGRKGGGGGGGGGEGVGMGGGGVAWGDGGGGVAWGDGGWRGAHSWLPWCISGVVSDCQLQIAPDIGALAVGPAHNTHASA